MSIQDWNECNSVKLIMSINFLFLTWNSSMLKRKKWRNGVQQKIIHSQENFLTKDFYAHLLHATFTVIKIMNIPQIDLL